MSASDSNVPATTGVAVGVGTGVGVNVGTGVGVAVGSAVGVGLTSGTPVGVLVFPFKEQAPAPNRSIAMTSTRPILTQDVGCHKRCPFRAFRVVAILDIVNPFFRQRPLISTPGNGFEVEAVILSGLPSRH